MTYSLQMEPRPRRRLPCAAGLLALALSAACASAQADTYTLPGALSSSPFNCTQLSAASYTCVGSRSLDQNTQLVLESDITLEITGSLATAQSFTTVNNGHSMTLIVRGALSMAQNVNVQMDISVNGAMTADGNARIDGNITVGDQYTAADLRIGQNSTITGNISSTKDIIVEQNVTLNGSAAAPQNIIFDSSPRITGNITAGNRAEFGQNAEISGKITATGDIEVRQNPKINGDVTSGGSINFAQNTHVTGNIKAGNNLDFDQNTYITGDVTATNTLSGKQNSTTVTGNCTASTIIDMDCGSYGHQPPAGSLHHIRLNHNGSGVTCAPSTITVTACNGADSNGICSPYTSGVSGTVTGSGAAGSASFDIASGSSTTTVPISDTTAETITLAVSGLSVSAAGAATCWNSASGNASCNHSYSTAGFLFDVKDHVADALQTVEIRAVRSAADQTNVCAPAFTSATNVNLTCAYVNPGTGSKVITLNGQPQPVCNSPGQTVALQFDSTGKANATLRYPDAGNMSLTIGYPAFGMSSSDGFVAAPARFAFGFVQATAQAGVALTGVTANGTTTATTLTAVNLNDQATPNFGRETAPEPITISFNKCLPAAGSAGASSGTAGPFTNGVARPSGMKWSEVGQAYLTATLTDGGYLNSALHVSGTSAGAGTVPCPGAIRFTPAYFTTALSPPQPYSYSGQPIATVRVTPYNGDGAITANYTGTLGIAKPLTLSPMYLGPAGTVIAVPATRGALAPNTVAASAFTAPAPVGANALPAFAFAVPSGAPGANQAPLQLIVRASDGDASSAGHAEATAQVRFGRLRLFNAYGRANGDLSVPVQAQYWTGLSWIINSDDSTTVLPDSALALTPSSASGVTARSDVQADGSRATKMTAGTGILKLAKSNNVAGNVGLAYNLGSTGADVSCLADHPATTGAALPWLRSLNGCANDYGRDPSSRATFGVFKPETKSIIHVRERFD